MTTDKPDVASISVQCSRCSRMTAYDEPTHRAMVNSGARFLCPPCDKPGEWKWERHEDQVEYMVPLTEKEKAKYAKKQPGFAERKALAARVHLVQSMKDERGRLLAYVKETQERLDRLATEIPRMEADLPALERAAQAAVNDGFHEKKQDVEKLKAKIAALQAQLAGKDGKRG